jgi:hypothetical protein
MSGQEAQIEHLNELVNSPPGDPARKELEELLSKMDPAEQEIWLGMVKESDRLHAELISVDVPAGLDGRLLRIADAPAKKARWWRPGVLGPIGWKQAAALLMVIGVLTYLWWPSGEPVNVRPKPLDSELALKISNWALQNQMQASLDVRSADPETVKAALKAKNLPFPVSMLEPVGKLELTGGGVCRFGTAPAAYTQWKSGDEVYTLYQFDGSELGVPDDFQETEQSPDQNPQANANVRVKIWPGGGGLCTWALVTDTDSASNLFGESYQ